MHFLKHIDFGTYLGNIASLGFFSASFITGLESGLRILCLVGSLVVGWVTYRHTQEKRAFLKQQKKEAED